LTGRGVKDDRGGFCVELAKVFAEKRPAEKGKERKNSKKVNRSSDELEERKESRSRGMITAGKKKKK